MCFSAEASFTTAAVLSVVGSATLLKTQTSNIRPFAIIPLFFALQQALEGIVWVTLNAGDVTSLLHKIGVFGFLFFANLFWPLWIPGVIYRLEENQIRKKLLLGTFIIGIFVSAIFLLVWILLGRTAHSVDHHIVYKLLLRSSIGTDYIRIVEVVMLVAYFMATVLPFFISSLPRMWILGLIVGIGSVVAYIFYSLAFVSVWCFFAAIASISIYFIVIQYNKTIVKNQH
jgi:hypothetical protein